ncbi:hypothetical protein BH23PLA1_BH23PLA1_39730 [soil metagenome]
MIEYRRDIIATRYNSHGNKAEDRAADDLDDRFKKAVVQVYSRETFEAMKDVFRLAIRNGVIRYPRVAQGRLMELFEHTFTRVDRSEDRTETLTTMSVRKNPVDDYDDSDDWQPCDHAGNRINDAGEFVLSGPPQEPYTGRNIEPAIDKFLEWFREGTYPYFVPPASHYEAAIREGRLKIGDFTEDDSSFAY